MNIFKEHLLSLRSHVIQYIHEYIKENGDQKLEKYSVFINPGLGVVAISPIPYVMCDGSTKLSTDVDTDTLCEIADELIKNKLESNVI